MHEPLAVLAEGRYAAEVADEAALWRGRAISAVPAVVVEASTSSPAASRRGCLKRR